MEGAERAFIEKNARIPVVNAAGRDAQLASALAIATRSLPVSERSLVWPGMSRSFLSVDPQD